MPQQRQSLAPLFAGMAAALIVLGVAFFIFSHRSATSPVASSPTTAPSVAATQDLLECLVCGKAVDPATTPFKLDFRGQRLYFDRQECLDAFVANPNRYGHLRVDVRWSAKPGDEPSTIATQAPAAACSPPDVPDSVAPADDASATAEPPAPPEDNSSPAETDSGSPPCVPASSAPCDSCTNTTTDPNPPPLHQSHHHHDGGQSDGSAPPPSSGSPAAATSACPNPPAPTDPRAPELANWLPAV